MPRLTRPAVAVALAATMLVGASALSGCMFFQKPAPVLTQEQLAAGMIGEDHPVTQAEASERGCECHIEAASKAAGK